MTRQFGAISKITEVFLVTMIILGTRVKRPRNSKAGPTLGLASVLMLRLISPELVLFPDFCVSKTPRYVCFSFNKCNTGKGKN